MLKYKLERKDGVVDASLGFKDTVKRKIVLPVEVAINYPSNYPTEMLLPRKLVKYLTSKYSAWQIPYADGIISVFTHEDGWDYTTIWKELKSGKGEKEE